MGGAGAADRGVPAEGKTPPRDLRRTIGAIVWRHVNGATWRAIPAEHGPWWRAAQLFIRWAGLGVWPRLLEAAQARGVELGMAFLDGTSVRAHPKAAGAPKTAATSRNGTGARRSAALAAVRHQGVRDRRRPGPGGRVRARARPGARAAARGQAPRPAPRCRCGSWATAATARTRSGSWSGRAARGPRSRPAATRRRSPARTSSTTTATGRAALGPAQGVAGRRHPLREDRGQLPRRALPRRHRRLAQALTGPNTLISNGKVWNASHSSIKSFIFRFPGAKNASRRGAGRTSSSNHDRADDRVYPASVIRRSDRSAILDVYDHLVK